MPHDLARRADLAGVRRNGKVSASLLDGSWLKRIHQIFMVVCYRQAEKINLQQGKAVGDEESEKPIGDGTAQAHILWQTFHRQSAKMSRPSRGEPTSEAGKMRIVSAQRSRILYE